MKNIETQAFSLQLPPIFNNIRKKDALVIATSDLAYQDQPINLRAYISEIALWNNDSYEGKTLQEKFTNACVASRYKAELVSQGRTAIHGCETFLAKIKIDAKWQKTHFKIHSFFVCMLVSEEYAIELAFDYEFQHTEKIAPHLDAIVQSIRWEDAETIKNAFQSQVEAEEKAYKDSLAAQEKERAAEKEKQYENLYFNPPKKDIESVTIDGFSVDILQEETRWYIAKGDHKFYVEIKLQVQELEKAINEKLLSDWKSENGEVRLRFYATNIFKNNIPTGQFKLKQGKQEQNYKVYLQLFDFEYALGFDGYVYLQEGWIGIHGWLQNEHKQDHQFKIELYKQFNLEDLNWTHYWFTENELEDVQPDLVHYLSYSDEKAEVFPEKILTCKNVKELRFSGGSTYWKSNHYESTFAPLNEVPKEIGTLTELTHLSLHNLNITELPETIGHLRNLTNLSIHACKISQIPESIFQLPRLTYLSVTKTEITELPKKINLPKLRSINVEKNQLKTLPESICKQPQLKNLNLENNPFESLPKPLSDSQYDVKLDIDDKRRLLDFNYQGVDGKGLVEWDDAIFLAQKDAKLIQPVIDIIEKEKLEKYKTPLLAQVKKAIGFKHLEGDNYDTIGNHRFGGFPDLPTSIPYPTYYNDYDKADYVYEFIAQINCKEITHLQDYLPRTGMLYFFLTTDHDIYGGSQPAKVIWFDGELSTLKSGKHISYTVDDFFEVSDIPPYLPNKVEAFKMNSVPGFYSYQQNKHWFNVPDGAILYKKLENEDYNDDDRIYDLYEEPVEFLKKYNYAMNSYMFTQHESPELQASLKLKGKPEDWIILLKVTSSGDFQWGDAGDLAFVIHKSDLAKCDFSNVFCTLESS